MGLIDRLQSETERSPTTGPSLFIPEARHQLEAIAVDVGKERFQALKDRIQDLLLKKIDITKLEEAGYAPLLAQINAVIDELVEEEHLLLADADRHRLIEATTGDMLGLGPLEPLLQDNDISDILVNGYRGVWIERKGKIYKTAVRFRDDQHLLSVITRIVSRVGRRIDEASPMVDARLPDGSRVHAIIPPLAIDGPVLSIRRFGRERLKAEDLVRNRTLTPPMLDLLKGCIQARLNMVISGGTGAGKTTLLNMLSQFISDRERILTIEDAAELQLHQRHVVRLETRPPNIEGQGAIRQRQLVINALRMRPDRILVGEVRGEEALDMLQAMNTGHEGSLTTVHANTPRDALSRLETMVAMANLNLPESAIRRQIASAIDVIVQVSRQSDGTRKVISIAEVTGMEGEVITMQDIFVYQKKGIGPNGQVLGDFMATGIRPKFAERLLVAGFRLPIDMFERKQAETA